MRVTKILAVSGSLRAGSINSALLRAAARLAAPGLQVNLLGGLGNLPLFNPDRESPVPPAVAQMRSAVASADALLIASPEYAHGVTGAIKNMLDWLVSYEPFVFKPVAVLNASSRSHHADAVEWLDTSWPRIILRTWPTKPPSPSRAPRPPSF